MPAKALATRCQLPRCRRPVDVVYIGRGVCVVHWDRYMDESQPEGTLRRTLNIPDNEGRPEGWTPATKEVSR